MSLLNSLFKNKYTYLYRRLIYRLKRSDCGEKTTRVSGTILTKFSSLAALAVVVLTTQRVQKYSLK